MNAAKALKCMVMMSMKHCYAQRLKTMARHDLDFDRQ